MNKIEWRKKPCGVDQHKEVYAQDYATCSKCGSVRKITLGQDYGKVEFKPKYYKWAKDSLGTSYLVECDQFDNERIR